MTTLRESATMPSGPALLGPRVSPGLLGRLGERVETGGPRDALEVEMPATATPLAPVPRCSPEDVEEAAGRARAAQGAWAATPVRDRAEVLLRFAELVLDNQEEALDIIQLESGKARRHAFEEIIDVAQVARYYARTAPRLLAPSRRAGAIPGLTRVWEHHHPKGVVGVISPWNYPLTLGVSDALPALVAGNAVLAKPDQQTPFSALWAAERLEEAGLPAGVLQVVTGSGAELGDAIIGCSDFVMFTGSTRPEIAMHLLPVALAWSTDANPERRQSITTILSLMSHSSAQEALRRLQTDANPYISTSAKRAAEKVRRA